MPLLSSPVTLQVQPAAVMVLALLQTLSNPLTKQPFKFFVCVMSVGFNYSKNKQTNKQTNINVVDEEEEEIVFSKRAHFGDCIHELCAICDEWKIPCEY